MDGYEESSYLVSNDGVPLKCKIEIVDGIFPYGKHVMDRYYENVKSYSFVFDLWGMIEPR